MPVMSSRETMDTGDGGFHRLTGGLAMRSTFAESVEVIEMSNRADVISDLTGMTTARLIVDLIGVSVTVSYN